LPGRLLLWFERARGTKGPHFPNEKGGSKTTASNYFGMEGKCYNMPKFSKGGAFGVNNNDPREQKALKKKEEQTHNRKKRPTA